MLGTYLAAPPSRVAAAPNTNDLLLLLGNRPEAPAQSFDTSEAAAAFLRTETAARVAAPRLDGFSVTGAGIVETNAPVPFYQFSDGTVDLRIYAFTYAYLDRIADEARLARPILNRAAAQPVVQPLGATTALVWRDRATVFLAFTEDTPAPLLDAIR